MLLLWSWYQVEKSQKELKIQCRNAQTGNFRYQRSGYWTFRIHMDSGAGGKNTKCHLKMSISVFATCCRVHVGSKSPNEWRHSLKAFFLSPCGLSSGLKSSMLLSLHISYFFNSNTDWCWVSCYPPCSSPCGFPTLPPLPWWSRLWMLSSMNLRGAQQNIQQRT